MSYSREIGFKIGREQGQRPLTISSVWAPETEDDLWETVGYVLRQVEALQKQVDHLREAEFEVVARRQG